MFGFLKKKESSGNFIIAAVEAAAILRAVELQSGGQFTDPDVLIKTTNSIIKRRNIESNETLEKITHSCVMQFLMDQSFIDGLLNRSKNGPIGTLTENDEREIERIVGKFFK